MSDYDRLRPLVYPDSDVIIICFSIDRPYSLENVLEKVTSLSRPHEIMTTNLQKWTHEVLHFCQGVPIILAGLQLDLRYDPRTIEELLRKDQHPVSWKEVNSMPATIGNKNTNSSTRETPCGRK